MMHDELEHTVILRKGEVLSLHLSGRPFRVACVAGLLWATVDRSAADHALAPGGVQTFRGRGTVVIQALRTATAHIELIQENNLPLGNARVERAAFGSGGRGRESSCRFRLFSGLPGFIFTPKEAE